MDMDDELTFELAQEILARDGLTPMLIDVEGTVGDGVIWYHFRGNQRMILVKDGRAKIMTPGGATNG